MKLSEILDELETKLDPTVGELLTALRKGVEELEAQNSRLGEQVAHFQRILFGKRSEKIPPIKSEVRRRVEEDELTVDGEPMPDEPKAKARERRRKARKKSEPTRKKKRALRKNLPVVKERITVRPDQLPEGMSLEDFREVGEGELVHRVDHVREHLVHVEYHLQTLASRGEEDAFVRAEAPPGVVEGGHYGPGIYAHVITAKCADSLPLHRIERMLERGGCPIARSTLCSFFHRGAELMSPIYERLLDIAQHDPYVHSDETTLKVQQKGQCLTGWIWTVVSQQAIAFAFDESREGEVAERLLGDSAGFLMVDGYSGYNGATGADRRIRVGCWAHARRKFYEALKSAPEAREVLDLIVELYRVEYEAAEKGILGTDAHRRLRRKKSRAILKKIDAWVDDREDVFPPRGKMGKALTYATNQRGPLSEFLNDARLPLDNNIAERALRIIALGRKNFLFAGHVEGAQNLAVLQTVVATCLLHGVNPYEYLKDLLIRIQHHPATDVDALLPWNWSSGPIERKR